MRFGIVRDGWPWIGGALLLGVLVGFACQLAGWGTTAIAFYATGVVGFLFMLYFFRDPVRVVPVGDDNVLAGADGWVRRIDTLREDRYLHEDAVRISIFLSPFDVHVNRSPVSGGVRQLDYSPGRHLLTIRNAASEVNEHSSILIDGGRIPCLVRQIVGPVVRRVVYWLKIDQEIGRGDTIGMMKFGSRLDIYLPASRVEVLVKKGDRVFAGTSIIAMIKGCENT